MTDTLIEAWNTKRDLERSIHNIDWVPNNIKKQFENRLSHERAWFVQRLEEINDFLKQLWDDKPNVY